MDPGRSSPHNFLLNFSKIFFDRLKGTLSEQLYDPGAARYEFCAGCSTKISQTHMTFDESQGYLFALLDIRTVYIEVSSPYEQVADDLQLENTIYLQV